MAPATTRVASTIEAKWALNEGFLYFPDLAVRGFGTQLIGSREFNLTVAGFDLGIGKQIPVMGMCTITPYLGWSSVWVAASSSPPWASRFAQRSRPLPSK